MTGKIILNAMHINDLTELLANDEIELKCDNCGVDIIDLTNIGGLAKKNDNLIAICKKKGCMEFIWKNAMEVKDA